MSTGELERVEVMGRVAKKELKLSDAATMLHLSYRQVKRLWRRYRKVGAPGLQHGNAGQAPIAANLRSSGGECCG
jgi:transposase